MPRYILILFAIALGSCRNTIHEESTAHAITQDTDSIADDDFQGDDVETIDSTTDYKYATYFIVIADTGFDYSSLNSKMYTLNRQLKISIDTMSRYYNEAKDLIALPDSADDEIYAGDYFPRRFPSDNLSLEYLDFYKRETIDKTIALVAGIYETEESADSALSILKTVEGKAFKLKSDVFVGCMH